MRCLSLRHLTVFMTAAAAGLSAIAPPLAAAPKDFAAYAILAGEVGEARATCGFDMDSQALLALGRAFRLSPGDAAAQDKVAGQIADGLAQAHARMRRQGQEAFCRDMLADYGPSGGVAAGLLKLR